MRALRVGLPGGRSRDRLRRSGRLGRRGALARGAALQPARARLAWVSRPEGVWTAHHVKARVDRARRGSIRWGRSSTCVATPVEPGDGNRCCRARSGTSPSRGTPTASPRDDARAGPGTRLHDCHACEEPVEYIWFVADFASFDERVQRESNGSPGSCTTPACPSGCCSTASATRATTSARSASRACSRCSSSTT